MKKLIVLAFAFFAIAAVASQQEKKEADPEKEAFLSARYETLKKLCAQKDARACKRVIFFYKKDDLKYNEHEAQTAMQTLLDGCKEGKFGACMEAGKIHIENKNYDAAKELLLPACLSGHYDSCAVYGRYLEKHSPAKSKKHAQKIYEFACDKNSALGCENLGLLLRAEPYLHDEPQDLPGYFYLKKACEIDARRCLSLGISSLSYDPEDAIKALTRNCFESDMLAGCIMLTEHHKRGALYALDDAEVKRVYARLCERAPYKKEYCQAAQ